MKILIFGNGYVGSRCAQAWGREAVLVGKKLATTQDVLDVLESEKPDVVLNAAGVRGKPNVDWCETHQMETILGNTKLPIIIAEACQKKNIYLLHIGSGCIFYGDSPDPKGWAEDDFGNPKAVYTRAKWAADLALSVLPNVGIARIRMPIDYIPSQGNLIDKLAGFKKVVNVENSVTVVEDMIDTFYKLLQKKGEGIFHVTNPGSIKHKEIIEMYEQIVDSNHKNEWIDEGDLLSCGLVDKKRSNNIMQSRNLEKLGIHMRPVKEAVRDTLEKYAKEKGLK